MHELDVLAIGHIDKGRVIVGGQSHSIAGGAVHFGGMVLLALGLRVGVVTKVAKEDLVLLSDLRNAGAFIFPVFSSETTAIENVLPDPNSDQRRCFRRGFAGTFHPEDLPPVKAKLYYVGTIITDEIDLAFLHALAERGPIALDAQGCLRKVVGDELVTDGWDWADEALPLVQFLKVDDKEARALTGEGDLYQAAEILGHKGPQEVVLTHRDGVLVWAKEELFAAPFKPKSLAGRTGRGDTCFSAYIGRRLLGDSPKEATRFAAALTTLKLERPGPFRSSLEEVYRLLAVL